MFLYINQFYLRILTANMAATTSEQLFLILGSIYFASVVLFIMFELWQRLGTSRISTIDLPPLDAMLGHATPPPSYQSTDGPQDAAQLAGNTSPTGLSIFDIR